MSGSGWLIHYGASRKNIRTFDLEICADPFIRITTVNERGKSTLKHNIFVSKFAP